MRIVAGKYKGKTLATFDADNIRPTSDRVKEAIFSKFQFDMPDSVVLDLFGGTGNLGLEALSRGAKKVVICDNNENSIALIKANCNTLKAEPVVLKDDYNKCIKLLKDEKFDFIFLDPPYAGTYGEKAIEQIAKFNILSLNGIIIFEHSKGKVFDLFNFELFDQKTYGTMQVSYLRCKND